MSKITLSDLASLQNETSAITTINTNNDTVVAAVDNTLSRDGTAPNFMLSNIDMNSLYTVTNLKAPVNPTDAVRFQDIGSITGDQLTQAHADATTAAAAAVTATTQASNAAASAVLAASYIGAATSAAKWTTSRTLAYTGDATGSSSVDGSANVSTALTLATSGVTAATYGSGGTSVGQFTVDAKGRITSASNVAIVSAPKLATARTISLTGPVTGSVSFDGTANVAISTTLTSPGGPIASSVSHINVSSAIVRDKDSGFGSISRSSTGLIIFVFSTPAADAFYKIAAIAQKKTVNSALNVSIQQGSTKDVNGFSLAVYDNNGTLQDYAELDVLVFA